MKKIVVCLMFIGWFGFLNAQHQSKTFPKGNFRAPIGIPMYLAGNFAELRPNHFHSGIDIKTNGGEGYRVYAAADGYVSRIKISPYGYGKAIYIDHPNGYTTVYAHLSKFKGAINDYIIKEQTNQESFEIDVYLPDSTLMVKKGDVIALSGNSGSSGGPHLHFEIRNTKTEHALNPLLFGFDIKDDLKPTIKSLAVYPLDNSSVVNNKNEKLLIKAKGINGNYQPVLNELNVFGNIGIGIEVEDHLNGTPNRNGVYSIELYDNEELIFKHQLDSFSFDETRCMNAHIDFATKLKENIRLQRTFKLPNNYLSSYKVVKNNGVIVIGDKEEHHIKIVVKDAYLNASTIQLKLKGQQKQIQVDQPKGEFWKYNVANHFENEDIKVYAPENSLYQNIYFEYETSEQIKYNIVKTHHVHNWYEPLDKPIKISLHVPNLESSLKNKAVIVYQDERGRYYSKGGEWTGNYITTESKNFGLYGVMIDTIPPKVKPVNIYNNKYIGGQSTIVVEIADNLSGIKSYKGYIDGKFVIFEYEPKKRALIYYKDGLDKGAHQLQLTVTDGVGNESNLSINFKN
jgi:hypothetical protein